MLKHYVVIYVEPRKKGSQIKAHLVEAKSDISAMDSLFSANPKLPADCILTMAVCNSERRAKDTAIALINAY